MVLKPKVRNVCGLSFPEGPSTQYLSFLVPNTVKTMVFGTRNPKYCVLGPLGIDIDAQSIGKRRIRETLLDGRRHADGPGGSGLSLVSGWQWCLVGVSTSWGSHSEFFI